MIEFERLFSVFLHTCQSDFNGFNQSFHQSYTRVIVRRATKKVDFINFAEFLNRLIYSDSAELHVVLVIFVNFSLCSLRCRARGFPQLETSGTYLWQAGYKLPFHFSRLKPNWSFRLFHLTFLAVSDQLW